MSVTAVVTKSDAGMPMTFETYATGTRYLIDSGGNLEILSAASEPIGLYGSGNWLSVYIDDSVECKPWENPPSSAAGAPAAQSGFTVVPAFDGLVEVLPALPDPGTDERPVPIRPYSPAASADPVAAAADATGEPAAEPESTLPPGMMPVAFGPKPVRPPREKPAEPAARRFMALTFTHTPHRRPPEPEPEPGPRFQTLSFSHTFRAKGERVRPAPVELPDSDDSGNDAGGAAPEAS